MKLTPDFKCLSVILGLFRHLVVVQRVTCSHSVFLSEKQSYGEADFQAWSSDSDDEVMGQYQEAMTRSRGLRSPCSGAEAPHQKSFSWKSQTKYCPLSAEYDGYSSEASAEDGE